MTPKLVHLEWLGWYDEPPRFRDESRGREGYVYLVSEGGGLSLFVSDATDPLLLRRVKVKATGEVPPGGLVVYLDRGQLVIFPQQGIGGDNSRWFDDPRQPVSLKRLDPKQYVASWTPSGGLKLHRLPSRLDRLKEWWHNRRFF